VPDIGFMRDPGRNKVIQDILRDPFSDFDGEPEQALDHQSHFFWFNLAVV
jgi:hypothetical protein